ncbi:Splicing factor isoform 1 [Micractinium conductrix]|uniref:Splicing factor isoform 1 n=1 Tax=Micractinium conductrix TaxID=554055 RepID=A0A2P6VFC4_9CHLO|nr:Splicing factor isoform 1 [Micractinium conductrix]|eukprot:PSC72790.1 Splicing factor isoform 1 [Micractinium conductrix]
MSDEERKQAEGSPPADANGGSPDREKEPGSDAEEKKLGSRSRSRDKRRRSRSRSRERRRRRDGSRERRRRSRSRDRRRSRSRDRKRRSPERAPDRGPERGPERGRGPFGGGRGPFGGGGYRRRSLTPPEVRAERERKAALEDLDREARTVFAFNLPLKAEEKEIFQFFVRAGPINDIKIISDRGTGRSKGFAYIEFQRKEDIMNALQLMGQPMMGQPVMVKTSEAEKNLAWEAAEQAKRQQKELEARVGPEAAAAQLAAQLAAPPAGVPAPPVPSGPARLAVQNLPTAITEADVRPIFEPFGALDFVTMATDAVGQPTGTAFVQYRSLADATKAKENLHGLDLAGNVLAVEWAPVEVPPPPLPTAPVLQGVVPATIPAELIAAMGIAPGMTFADLAAGPGGGLAGFAAAAAQQQQQPGGEQLNEGADGSGAGGGLKLTGGARAALMSKLAATAGLDTSNVPQIPMPQMQQPQMPAALQLEQGMLGPASPIPTQCLLLKNMFAPEEETGDGWDQEIAEDVGGECGKYGQVLHVFVDRASRGFVYIKFADVAAATNAQRALHGRWFAARQIAADFQFTQIYNAHFGR